MTRYVYNRDGSLRYVERYGKDGWKEQPGDEEGKWTKGECPSSGSAKSMHKVTTGAAGATADEAGVRQTSETLPDKSLKQTIDPNGGEVKGSQRQDYRAAAPKHEPGWRTVGGGAGSISARTAGSRPAALG